MSYLASCRALMAQVCWDWVLWFLPSSLSQERELGYGFRLRLELSDTTAFVFLQD